MKISEIKADLPNISLDLRSKYGPKKWLKSEDLMRAPFPEIKHGMRLMRESRIGSLKYGKIKERPTGSYDTVLS